MSGFLVVCSRDAARPVCTSAYVEACARRVDPEGIVPREPLRAHDAGLDLVVTNPVHGILFLHGSVCLGYVVDRGTGWALPGSSPPEGSYALCRHDAGTLELVSDAVGSRTIWYVVDSRFVAASTSQRALVAFLASFRLDPLAASWMLSSGLLGPSASWDARLRRLPPHARLRLDRRSWSIDVDKRGPEFSVLRLPDDEHRRRLHDALLEACSGHQLDHPGWLMTLSGGVDSRGVLLGLLGNERRPACVTWGSASTVRTRGSDACVASEVARRLGLELEFLDLDGRDAPLRRALSTFLKAGEGRIDHFAAYTDGMRMWRTLAGRGVSGVIRGDETLGGSSVASGMGARKSVYAVGLPDYPEEHPIRRLGLPLQEWPAHLRRRSGETVMTYRDRLEQEYEVPTSFAALTQLKSAYVEVANPLVAAPVLRVVQSMPDRLREGKTAFKRLVTSLGPPIPFATVEGPKAWRVMANDEFRRELTDELSSARAGEILDPAGLRAIVGRLGGVRRTASAGKRRLRLQAVAAHHVPPRILARLRAAAGPPVLSAEAVAFRAYIVTRMVALLEEDAAAGASLPGGLEPL